MERLNEIVLFLITIIAIASLLKELDYKRNQIHGLALKMIFGGIAIGSLLALFYSQTVYYFIMNCGFLSMLLNRFIAKDRN